MEIDEPVAQNKSISIDVLALTNDARNTYGLRYQDYERYRHYCAQRLHRLRKVLDFTHSKGKGFQKKQITTDVVSDEKHLHLLLFNAERAWAYAQELKRDTTSNPRKRHHMVRRLRKAAHFASELAALCSSKCNNGMDARSALDAQAYSSLMCGYLLVEEEAWEKALDKFVEARILYEKLAPTGTHHQEALCNMMIDEINPNIRFCSYNMRGKGFKGVEEFIQEKRKDFGHRELLDKLPAAEKNIALSETVHKKSTPMTSLTWRGHSISLNNAELAVLLLQVQDAEIQLEEHGNESVDKRMEEFDKILSLYGDAEKVAMNALKFDADVAARVKSSKSDQNTANHRLAYTYVVYRRLSRTTQRNLVLVESLKKDLSQPADKLAEIYHDIVKLYDNVLQNLAEMKGLPAISDDTALSNLVDAKIMYFKAWRCLFVAEAYEHRTQHAEAYALLGRVSHYSDQSRAFLVDTTPMSEDEEKEIIPVTEIELEELDAALRGRKSRVHAAWYLAQESARGGDVSERMEELSLNESTGEVNENLPIIECLDVYPPKMPLVKSTEPQQNAPGATTTPTGSVPHLVDFPPNLKPVPAKPIFYDIAFGHVEYPSALGQRSRQSGRLGGLFGGWWGNK
ncbi:uncharacterized protein VTP21DRAFT_5702 [Calcarisporiella thermophila]|uniref:uncharacterized protein n=1 Tax=Calcarisporiella thermophila TaxID=911321 RepID=UPI0037434F3D